MRIRSTSVAALQVVAVTLGALALCAVLVATLLLGAGRAQAAAAPRAPQPAPFTTDALPNGLPVLNVVKTIGLDPAFCGNDAYLLVEAGTTVYYCFTVINNQGATLIQHTVVDSQLGTIVEDLFLDVPVSGSTFITRSHTANASASNTVTWTAFTQQEQTVAGTASAELEVGTAALAVVKLAAESDTCAGSTNLEVPSGANVWYCVQITNTGDFTFTQHNISDPQLGINVDVDQELAPGATVTLSNNEIPALGPVAVTEAITNVVTVTSINDPITPPAGIVAAAVAPVTVSSSAQSVVTLDSPTSDGWVNEPGPDVFLPLMMR